MRPALLILSATLLSLSANLTAQAPDGSYLNGKISEPTFPNDAKLSLIIGHLATKRPLGSFPCPEGYICLDSVWDDTFADMETRLGPKIDPSAHIRSVHDAGLADNPLVAYIVKPDEDGQLWAIDLRVVQNNRACFDDRLADKWPDFASDRRTRRSGDEVCFRLS